jgi:hypothetical protein
VRALLRARSYRVTERGGGARFRNIIYLLILFWSNVFLPLRKSLMMFSILIPDRAAGMYNTHRAVRDNMDPTQPRDSEYFPTS